MLTTKSKDGTTIGFDRQGSGPVIIMVAGATQYRAVDHTTPSMAADLASRFTVVSYDRRGRGESGNTEPYAVAREIEDIEALIDNVGGQAGLFGMSSGGVLALEAACALPDKVLGVLLYEPPLDSERSAAQYWAQYAEMDALKQAGKGDEMMALFLRGVGMPPEAIEGFRQSPAWAGYAAAGPSIAHDYRVLAEAIDGDRLPERWQHVAMPVLVVHGDASFPFIAPAAERLAAAVEGGRQQILAGQGHDFDGKVLGPVIADFFSR